MERNKNLKKRWVVRAKKRKTKTPFNLTEVFEQRIFAEAAYGGFKAGFGSKYIRKHFTYFRVEEYGN